MKRNHKKERWLSIVLVVMMIFTLIGSVPVKTKAEETTTTEIETTTQTTESVNEIESTTEESSEKTSTAEEITTETADEQTTESTTEEAKSTEKESVKQEETTEKQEATVKNKIAKAPAANITGEQWCTNRNLGNIRLDDKVENATTSYGAKAEAFATTQIQNDSDTYIYWQTRYLTGKDKQTNVGADNGTRRGVKVDRIRCYNGTWQYSSDEGNTFRDIDGEEQLVFYYFMRTTIKKYAQIDISDWWHGLNECSQKHSKAVYIRIIDDDNPNTIYETTETFYYHEDHNGVGGIYITENADSEYEIVKADVQATKRYDNQIITWTNSSPENKYLSIVQPNVDVQNPISIDWNQGNHQIINLYVKKTADLSITKKVENADTGNQAFDVQITLTPNGKTIKDAYSYTTTTGKSGKVSFAKTSDGNSQAVVQLKADEMITLKGLEAGIGYQIKEIGDTSGYDITYQSSSGTTEKGGKHSVVITNAKKEVQDDSGSLTLTKTFSGLTNMSGALKKKLLENFKIQVTGKDGESYIVTPYTSLADGSVAPDTMIYGNEDSYTFTWELKTLTKGTYTVEEQGYRVGDGYIKIDATVKENDGLAGPEQEVSVEANGKNTVDFTNTYQVEPKTVEVTKTWRGGTKSPVIVALYQQVKGSSEETLATENNKAKYVTLSENNQWKQTWTELNPVDDDGKEILYTVKELEPVTDETTGAVEINGKSYRPVEDDGTYQENYKVSYDDKIEGKTTTWTITNTYQPKLIVTKKVEGDYGDLTKKFEIQITAEDSKGKPITGTYGKVVFNEDGKSLVSLKNNESIEITGLPDGTRYKIEETTEASTGYDVSYEKKEGTIQAGGSDQQVTVTNKSQITPDTGIFGIGGPSMKAAGILLAAGIVWLIFRRRNKRC